ncbi:winged helix DNA-binding domain-containing protein [Streptomyces sp. 15-116A]|uniref:winged helix DNA-binding domain-containing protein n=1 Tax=Streptomyces sp. 15-116A TaxID=2259035 RepID=UPI0021B413EF|nr:winged helix DNA-binding domain-containing protein [Streptomyces sp. 15-116A]MCT7351224.1 winged helix DNA-binding domain-containing protein [Streptomyces sp. 15-116A]
MTTTRLPQITWSQASARRRERQFLATPAPADVPLADVVGAMLGAHAQVLSAAELSVGLRTTGATRADVRAALWEDRSLVKTFGPRGTVHLLPAHELPLWCAALSAVPRGTSPFPPDVRLTEEQEEQVVAAIGDALAGACLTIDELSEEVVARTGAWAGDLVMPAFQDMWPRWRQVLHRAGWAGALCFGPNRGRKVTYTRPPAADVPTRTDATDAVPAFVRRYLHAYGPATPQHFAKWLATPAGWAAEVFRESALAGGIEEVEFEGARGWWVASGDTEFPSVPSVPPAPSAPEAGAAPGVRLLPYFDAYAIAAQPRERLFPGRAYERALAGGQAGNFPVLLVDGVVAGVWHQRRSGRRTTVTVEPLGSLTARQERELGEQVERVGEVLEARAELVVGEVKVGPHA